MEIKFNCSNPSCQQRIDVDSSYAGRSFQCPACNTRLQVPDLNQPSVANDPASFVEIVFRCSNPDCGQRIAVDGSRAGRWLKCPACDRALQVPGKAIESLIPQHSLFEPSKKTARPTQPKISPPVNVTWPLRFWWLLKGWGVGAALLGVLIAGLQFRSTASLPPHLDAMLDEVYFHGEILSAPVENKAGTALVYVRTVETGVGVFLVDLTSLDRTQIALAKASDSERGGAVKLFGWSPDDRWLAFSIVQQGSQNRHVMICDGTTGKLINSFEAPDSIEMGKWQNANSLVLIDHSHQLSLFNLETDNRLGQFGTKGLVPLKQLEASGGWPVPDSDSSTAYVEHGNLWSLNIPANQTVQLTTFTNGTPEWLDYDATGEKYLFDFRETGSTQAALYQYDTRAPKGAKLARLMETNYAFKGQWIEGGTGIAYVGVGGNRYCLTVETKDHLLRTNLFTAPPIDEKNGGYAQRLFIEGRQVVRTYSVNPQRSKIYTVASVSYEPLAIWEYDVAKRTFRNVVPEKETLVFSQSIVPVQASITNQSGRKIDYYYLPPARLDPDKKYPLVIDTFSDHGFQPNAQFLANAGIFYVTVSPYGAGLPEGPAAPEDTLAVYGEIFKNPNVDPHRIYLFGESAGTWAVANVFDSHPDLWRGAIMLSAVAFPKNPNGNNTFPSFFLSEGDEDLIQRQANAERFTQRACSHLLRTQILYAHAGHIFFDVNELKKRYKAIVTFILTDH